jgi:UDP-N-acetylglucosamine/UDP-N-acetylgalactosamine diphosphorylase
MMEDANKIYLAPNGNGSLFDAINRSSQVKSIVDSVDYVQIITVDNVLNKVLDPLLIGYTAKYDLYAGVKAC